MIHASCSFAASESLETLNVILASVDWVLASMVLITFFHTLEHGVAFWLSHVEGSASEIGGEEVTEGWNAGRGGGSSGSNAHNVGPSGWSWWHEEGGVVESESLHVWVLEVSSGHHETTLEWMTGDHKWMSVICRIEV